MIDASVNKSVPSGWPEAILFDLDGTLIDSVPDIAAAVNELLLGDDLPVVSVDAVRGMIGNGVKKLVERAYASVGTQYEGDALNAATDRMMGIYGKHLIRHTVAMPGALELISNYHRAGVRIGVVTNKPEAFTHEILRHFGIDGQVAVVVGGDTGPARKPEPDMLHHALSVMGVAASRALMVGDSPADIGAAKAANMASVAVHGGYTNVPADKLGADRVISSLLDLPAAIEALRPAALAQG
ncbi:HAD-IIIA family hydrolase [Hoeflea sp. EC-HK425]|uniref:HAD-IIIA family hydrolase n=1 Tax=Hoeflea sp. EC-HK425 TaxID=2038388 RepID=UPI0012558F2C|nr:HAD-IIIA family hydrolase [Hoeflea sp. EC-HK425]VVT10153.1 Phosphoglycolate phosphatase [Hoeflea sp. EC-HK425]